MADTVYNMTRAVEVWQEMSSTSALSHESAVQWASSGNWEAMLAPAPLAVYLIGHLLLVTGRFADVSLVDSQPSGGYQYIRYPHSLRASALQMSHEAYRAFLHAHVNLDRIRLQSRVMPRLAAHLVKVLGDGEAEEANVLVPRILEHLSDAAWDNQQLAKSVAQRFDQVRFLLEELLEACLGSDGATWLRWRRLQERRLTAAAQHAMQRTESLLELQVLDFLQQEIRRSRSEFEQAVDDRLANAERQRHSAISGLFSAFASLISTVISAILPSPGSLIFSVGSNLLRRFVLPELNYGEPISPVFNNSKMQPDCKNLVYRTVMPHIGQVRFQLLAAGVLEERPDEALWNVYDSELLLVATRNRLLRLAECQDQSSLLDAVLLLDRGIALLKRASSQQDLFEPEELRQFLTDLSLFEKVAKETVGFSLTDSKRPMNQEQKTELNRLPKSAQIALLAEIQYRMQAAQTMLRDALNKHQSQFEAYQDKMQQLRATALKIKSLDLEAVRLDQVKYVLNESILALTNLTTEWRKLSEFFHAVNTLVSFMEKPLQIWVSETNSSVHNMQVRRSKSSNVQELLYSYAEGVIVISRLLNTVTSAYSDFSSRFIMEELRTLGTVVYSSRTATPAQLTRLQEQMYLAYNSSNFAAINYAMERKLQLQVKTNQLIDRRNSLLASLDPIPQPYTELVQKMLSSNQREEDYLPSEDI